MSTLYNIGKNIGGFIVTTYDSVGEGSITNSEKARKSWISWELTEETLEFTVIYPESEPVLYSIPFNALLIDSVKYNTPDSISAVLIAFLNSPLVGLGDLENVRLSKVADGNTLVYYADIDMWKNK